MVSENVKPLFNILKSNKPPASKSLFNSILDSCILLSNAIHGIFLSDKIVNSVTALEILLKKDKEDFGVLSRRIKNFIGKFKFFCDPKNFEIPNIYMKLSSL